MYPTQTCVIDLPLPKPVSNTHHRYCRKHWLTNITLVNITGGIPALVHMFADDVRPHMCHMYTHIECTRNIDLIHIPPMSRSTVLCCTIQKLLPPPTLPTQLLVSWTCSLFATAPCLAHCTHRCVPSLSHLPHDPNTTVVTTHTRHVLTVPLCGVLVAPSLSPADQSCRCRRRWSVASTALSQAPPNVTPISGPLHSTSRPARSTLPYMLTTLTTSGWTQRHNTRDPRTL